MTTEVVQQGLTPAEGMELWAMQTDSTVYLETMGWNRYGQPIGREMKIGPKRKGFEFQISPSDRLENQRRILNPKNDPFRNGTFVRKDTDQKDDPNTASGDALTTAELMEITELSQDQFEARVRSLGEVAVRRLMELAESLDIGHKKVSFLSEYIRDTYTPGGPQKLVDGNGERLS